jgi:hypothetical protein
VGIGQMVNAIEGDQLSYDLTLARARSEGDQRAVTTLVKTGRPPYSGGPASVARKIAKVDLPNWRYTNADIRAAWRSASGGRPRGSSRGRRACAACPIGLPRRRGK